MRRLQDFTFNVHDRKDSDDIFFFGLILLCSAGVLAVMSILCSTSWWMCDDELVLDILGS